MASLLPPATELAGLFLASFLAATLLPGGSEVLLFALVSQHPQQSLAAWLLATLGNTLGGMSTYALARWLPPTAALTPKRAALARRWGPAVLLLAWVPIIGDALCAAAGWLRLPWLPSALWMAAGKGARYGLVVLVAAAST